MKTATKSFLLLTFFILLSNVGRSQTLVPDFAIHFLAGHEDVVQKSTIDKNGNLYFVGSFKSDTLIFGVDTLINQGSNDVFLVKMDSLANVIFAKSFQSIGAIDVTGLAIDANDNIYLAGQFKSQMTFGSIVLPESLFFYDIFLAKTDSNGNALWAKKYSYASDASIVLDSDQNVYLGGCYYGSLTIPSLQETINSAYPDRMFSLKMDSDGHEKWIKPYGGILAIDNAQNLYMSGSYSNYIHIGPFYMENIFPTENHNVYVAKSDSSGSVLWAKTFCKNEHALLNGASFDTLSNTLLITGTFKTDTLSFDDIVIHNNGMADLYIAKLDTSANVLYAKSYGGYGADYSWGLTRISPDYTAVLGTAFSDSIQLGDIVIKGGSTNSGYGDFFFFVIDNNGVPVWAKCYPKAETQSLKSIISDKDGNVIVFGDFSAGKQVVAQTKSAFVSDDPTFIDQTSIYLIRFKQQSEAQKIAVTAANSIDMYQDIASGTLTINIGNEAAKYTLKVYSSEGKCQLSKTLNAGTSTLDTGSLPKGLYLVKIESKDHRFNGKFIQNK